MTRTYTYRKDIHISQGHTHIARTYTYRIEGLTEAKHRCLDAMFRHLGWLRNQAVQYMRKAYEEEGKTPSYYDLTKWLTGKRADPRTGKWRATHQRSVVARVRKGYDAFFKNGAGLPRFANIDTSVHSFECEQNKPREHNGRYYVQFKGLGRFRFTDTRGVLDGAKVKVVRVVRSPLRYEIQLVCEIDEGLKVVDKRPLVGVDLGIKSPVSLSDGTQYDRIRISDTKQKRAQRKLSRAKKGSNGRAKAKVLAAKESRRVKDRRRNAIHRMTTDIVQRKTANLVIEDLKLKNMTRKGSRKRGLNRAMREAALGIIAAQLAYKASSAGGECVRVAPHYTTQQCSSCLEMPSAKVELWQREYECEHCGYREDRDVNAARNICRKGKPLHRAGITPEAGTEEATPVSPAPAGMATSQNRTVKHWI